MRMMRVGRGTTPRVPKARRDQRAERSPAAAAPAGLATTFPIDRPGLADTLADVQHLSCWEALRQFGRGATVAEMAAALARTDATVQRSLDAMLKVGLVRRIAATGRSQRIRYEVTVPKIIVQWDPGDVSHRAIHARIGQSFERRSAAHLAAALPFTTREPVRGYIDRRLFWGHFEPEDLAQLKAIVGMLDLLMSRVNARSGRTVSTRATGDRRPVPRCNGHVSFAVVPIPEEFPPPALLQLEGVANTPYARRHRAALAFERLTPRERQVFEGLLAGSELTEIGRSLGIRRPTVATLARHCYRKFGVGSRQELSAVAMGLAGPNHPAG